MTCGLTGREPARDALAVFGERADARSGQARRSGSMFHGIVEPLYMLVLSQFLTEKWAPLFRQELR
jgi:hypothetical protein